MSFRYEVRLSGSGGQGLILMGKVLAEAAAIYEDKNATQSQSYGPEARGGASKSEVIISDGEIDFPKADRLDLLLALTQEACDKYVKDLKEHGLLILDSEFVSRAPAGNYRVVVLPLQELARKHVGSAQMANILALGVIAELVDVVSKTSIEAAIKARVPRGTEEKNLTAFRAGMEAAAECLKQQSCGSPAV